MAVLVACAAPLQSSYGRKPAPMTVPSVKSVVAQVKESVKYPEFRITREDNGPIEVKFLITEEGTVQVVSLKAPTEKMEQYVRDQLSEVILKDIIHPYNQLYKMTLRFSMAG